jgi:hypothetical protein
MVLEPGQLTHTIESSVNQIQAFQVTDDATRSGKKYFVSPFFNRPLNLNCVRPKTQRQVLRPKQSPRWSQLLSISTLVDLNSPPPTQTLRAGTPTRTLQAGPMETHIKKSLDYLIGSTNSRRLTQLPTWPEVLCFLSELCYHFAGTPLPSRLKRDEAPLPYRLKRDE